MSVPSNFEKPKRTVRYGICLSTHYKCLGEYLMIISMKKYIVVTHYNLFYGEIKSELSLNTPL